VTQGAVLSPTLYNFFSSDASMVDGCEPTTFAVFVSSSDPTAVCDGLQEQLDSLTDYFKRRKIKVNSSKTQAIYFTKCWDPLQLLCFGMVFNGQKMKVKYLGVTLN
jgi:hypothetical protein